MSTDDEASPSGRGHIVHAKEKATYFQDRGIHIAPNPTGAADLPWPTSPPDYRRPVSRPELRPPTQPTPPANQGLVGRVASWFGPTNSNGSGRTARGRSSSATNGTAPPDFLSQSEDPDKRRLSQAQAKPREAPGTLEAKWRQDCLAFARVKKLDHVADMRIFYVDVDARDRDGDRVVVAVGAHYRSAAVTREDLLLHIVKEMEKIGSQRYVVVYFNADADLALIPEPSFFLDAHSALAPSHRRQLKAFHAVHSNRLLRAWIMLLRLSEPDIYGRVNFCERLANLNLAFSGGGRAPQPPQHVLDYDAEH
ncbi:g11802 [Coccomyxa elongata]